VGFKEDHPCPRLHRLCRDLFHRDATCPLYVYGYGSYGYPLPVAFSSTRLSLLDRGVVMAYAHIRGGGELGDTWHDAGKMQHKRNTFTDFIAVTEALTAQRYGSPPASPSKAAPPAVCSWRRHQHAPRPLPRGALPRPFRRHHEHHARRHPPLTVAEYEEWGNPNQPEAFATMLSYSPYDNLDNLGKLPGAPIPAILVKTSLNDSQVMYWSRPIRRQAPHPQDQLDAAPPPHQHGRRPRRSLRPLRLPKRNRLRLRLPPHSTRRGK